MKNVFFNIILLLSLVFLYSCDMFEYNNHNNFDERISINDYFGIEIEDYSEKILSIDIDCLSGECLELKQDLKLKNESKIKNCYFCSSSIIQKDLLALELDKMSSGSADFSFGCATKNYGPEINGLDIIHKSDDKIIAVGDVKYYKTRTSSSCDKTKDPECNSQVYGKCSEDYDAVIIYTVEMTFEK
jgi:hypothetical protein